MYLRPLIVLLAALLAVAPARAGDLIDIAIEVVNPDLKPARPIVECAIKGNSISACAIAEGKQQLAENEDVQRIFKVYNLANNKKWAELVAELGVTVACTAFEVPGSALVCNEFAGKVAEYGAKALKLGAEVHKKIGEKVVQTAAKAGKKVGCVTKIYCADEDKEDPNKFYWHFGGTTLSMRKFDLQAIWEADYAPRIGEGVKARINDLSKLQRMIAVPPPHLSGAGKISFTANAKAKTLGAPSVADLTYFLADDALAAGSMNQTTALWFATGAKGPNVNVHLPAFEPYEREMNTRWLAEVNKAAGETLQQPAQQLLAAQDAWRKQSLEPIAVKYFDLNSRTNSALATDLAPCRSAIDAPAMLLARWAAGAQKASDATLVEGHNANWWRLATSNWCQKTLAADMAGRRREYDAAISWGCTPKTAAKGLDCPEKPTAAKKPPVWNSNWSAAPKGEVGVVPVELCRNAYRVDGSVDPAYCSVSRASLPGVAAPLQPGTTTPEVAPQPSAPRQPAFRLPQIRPAVEPQKSTLCMFDAGPRAGERQDYAPMAPLPVGTPCHDGRGSTGKVIAP